MWTYDTLSKMVTAHNAAHGAYFDAYKNEASTAHQITMTLYRWQDVVNASWRPGTCPPDVAEEFRAYLDRRGIPSRWFCARPKRKFLVCVADPTTETAYMTIVATDDWRDAILRHPDIGVERESEIALDFESAKDQTLSDGKILDIVDIGFEYEALVEMPDLTTVELEVRAAA